MSHQEDLSIHWQTKSGYAKFWRTADRTALSLYLKMFSNEMSVEAARNVIDTIEDSGKELRSFFTKRAGRIVISDGGSFNARFMLQARDWSKMVDAGFASKLLMHVAMHKFGVVLDQTIEGHFAKLISLGDMQRYKDSFESLVLRQASKVVVIFNSKS